MNRQMLKAPAALLLAFLMVAAITSGALAEQKVRLPESSYYLMIPDGMEYDGPGTSPDDARFAYVSASLGLEIQFFCQPNDKGVSLQAMAEVLVGDGIETSIHRINGMEMIVYQTEDPGDAPGKGMKCIGYVLKDGNTIVEICFWYATKEAAKMTEEIISSIE